MPISRLYLHPYPASSNGEGAPVWQLVLLEQGEGGEGSGLDCRNSSRIPELTILSQPPQFNGVNPGSKPGGTLVLPMRNSALQDGFTRNLALKGGPSTEDLPSPGGRGDVLAPPVPSSIPPLTAHISPQPPRSPSCQTAGRPSARTAGWTSARWRSAARTRAGSRSLGKAEASRRAQGVRGQQKGPPSR